MTESQHTWQVYDVVECDTIVVDVTFWPDKKFTAMFNFVEEFSDEGNSGFTLCTQIHGESIYQIYTKIQTMIDVGVFDGTSLSGSGTLYDSEHNEIASILWNNFAADEWSESDGDEAALYDSEGDLIDFKLSDLTPPTLH